MPVIVIDPGHGGENRGGEYGDFVEKEINPIVAQAMKEYLEKFEDVTVYLTHETDVDMSIRDRVAFAAEKDADFLFCLHFNLSVNHNLYGAEVWVPSKGELYSKGYCFAQLQMQEMTDLGLFSRGIKTRLNDRDTDYYGILRYGAEYDVPCALIEHCHLDNEKDAFAVADGEESYRQLGIRDAIAVAKYFGLKSKELQVDYSGYAVPEVPVPTDIVRPDDTPPSYNELRISTVDEETGEVTLTMRAADPDNYIQYYTVSLDGGNTYSELLEWPRPEVWNESEEEYTFSVSVPFDRELEVRTMAYNGYDLFTESNIVSVEAIPDPERLRQEAQKLQEEALKEQQKDYEEITETFAQTQTKDTSVTSSTGSAVSLIVSLAVIVVLMMVLSVVLVRNLLRYRYHRRKR